MKCKKHPQTDVILMCPACLGERGRGKKKPHAGRRLYSPCSLFRAHRWNRHNICACGAKREAARILESPAAAHHGNA
jgi:hypothetical protein